MRTPVQQIKDLIENADWDSPEVNERIVNWIDDNMSELLLTEREIIEDAFFEGGLSNEPYEPLTGADYYNINFKE